MPRGDRTGPLGEGPMTGRGAGLCAGYAQPGYASTPGRAFPGRGMGGGFARGAGRGYRNRYYATGVPLSAYNAPGYLPSLERDEEIDLLKSESQRLKSVLENIDNRLEQLGREEK